MASKTKNYDFNFIKGPYRNDLMEVTWQRFRGKGKLVNEAMSNLLAGMREQHETYSKVLDSMLAAEGKAEKLALAEFFSFEWGVDAVMRVDPNDDT